MISGNKYIETVEGNIFSLSDVKSIVENKEVINGDRVERTGFLLQLSTGRLFINVRNPKSKFVIVGFIKGHHKNWKSNCYKTLFQDFEASDLLNFFNSNELESFLIGESN